MADKHYLQSLMGSVPPDVKRALTEIFNYVLKAIRFGRATGAQAPSENFAGHLYTATTPGVGDQEFSIPHRFNAPPYLAIPVLALDAVNSTLPPLTVTKPADGSRVYLKSSVTNATFTIYVEG